MTGTKPMPLVIMHFSQLSIFLDFLKVKENIFSRFAKSERIFLLLNSGMECKEPELEKLNLRTKVNQLSLSFLTVVLIVRIRGNRHWLIGIVALFVITSIFCQFYPFFFQNKKTVGKPRKISYLLTMQLLFFSFSLSLSLFFSKDHCHALHCREFFLECSIGLISTRKHGK